MNQGPSHLGRLTRASASAYETAKIETHSVEDNRTRDADSLEAAANRTHARRQIDILNRGLNVRNPAVAAASIQLASFSRAPLHDIRSFLRRIHGFSEPLSRNAGAKLSSKERGRLQTMLMRRAEWIA